MLLAQGLDHLSGISCLLLLTAFATPKDTARRSPLAPETSVVTLMASSQPYAGQCFSRLSPPPPPPLPPRPPPTTVSRADGVSSRPHRFKRPCASRSMPPAPAGALGVMVSACRRRDPGAFRTASRLSPRITHLTGGRPTARPVQLKE